MSPKSSTPQDPGVGVLDAAAIGAPARPQVNLLPPEVRSRRALGRVKARLALAVALLLLVAALGFVYAVMAERSAERELTAKEDAVQVLMDKQAQFAEVPQVKAEIGRVQEARAYGMSTEVVWKDFIGAIQAVAPAGVTIKTLVIDLPTPGVSVPPPANPLAATSVGTITFTGKSDTLPDVAAWLDALDGVPGFSDPAFSTATITSEEGATGFDVTSTVQVDETVFAHRFDQTEDAG